MSGRARLLFVRVWVRAEALPPAEEVVVAAGGLLALLWAPAVVKVSGLPTRLERPPRGTILFAAS